MDVVAGGALGFLLGWLVEVHLSGWGRALCKTLGGIFTSANWAYYVFVPAAAGNSRPRYIAVTIMFYVYALALLFTSLPPSTERAGAQTIDHGAEGSVCINYW